MYRQGDILLVTAAARPSSAARATPCVLARGEATGHRHQILDHACLWIDTDGTKYVEVDGLAAVLVHDEHGPITLPGPALYRVVPQREYTPDGSLDVAD